MAGVAGVQALSQHRGGGSSVHCGSSIKGAETNIGEHPKGQGWAASEVEKHNGGPSDGSGSNENGSGKVKGKDLNGKIPGKSRSGIFEMDLDDFDYLNGKVIGTFNDSRSDAVDPSGPLRSESRSNVAPSRDMEVDTVKAHEEGDLEMADRSTEDERGQDVMLEARDSTHREQKTKMQYARSPCKKHDREQSRTAEMGDSAVNIRRGKSEIEKLDVQPQDGETPARVGQRGAFPVILSAGVDNSCSMAMNSSKSKSCTPGAPGARDNAPANFETSLEVTVTEFLWKVAMAVCKHQWRIGQPPIKGAVEASGNVCTSLENEFLDSSGTISLNI